MAGGVEGAGPETCPRPQKMVVSPLGAGTCLRLLGLDVFSWDSSSGLDRDRRACLIPEEEEEEWREEGADEWRKEGEEEWREEGEVPLDSPSSL